MALWEVLWEKRRDVAERRLVFETWRGPCSSLILKRPPVTLDYVASAERWSGRGYNHNTEFITCFSCINIDDMCIMFYKL